MATDIQVVQTGQYWFVVTSEGRFGPMDSQQEATAYARLLQIAMAAGNETACTDAECMR